MWKLYTYCIHTVYIADAFNLF